MFRVGIAYLAAAWLLLQVADMVLSNFAAPASRLDEVDPEAYALFPRAKHILDERTPLESIPIAEGFLRKTPSA